jgi:hypothetical protein
MRAFERRLATCAGVGFVAAIGMFGVNVVENGNPAEAQQALVDACAPHLPLEGQPHATSVPGACEQFAFDFQEEKGNGFIYDLPAQNDFVREFSPGEHYNLDHYLTWAAASVAWGALVTAGSYVIAKEFGPKNKPSNQPQPNPYRQISVREYRRRYAEVANNFPPENLNDADYQSFITHAVARQQSSEN